MFFSRRAGVKLYSAGDLQDAQFAVGDFTKDGSYNELDISGIVPVGTKIILVFIKYLAAEQGKNFIFRPKGYTDYYNALNDYTEQGSLPYYKDGLIWVSSDRIIEYNISAATWAIFDFTIRGWIK